jgi:cell division protein FtsQ
MGETVAIQHEKFFRPKRKKEDKGGERFQGVLKKAIGLAFLLLLLSLFLFVGHRIYGSLLEDPFLRVREVEIEGCRKVKKEALLKLAKMEGMPNLFMVRLDEIARRIESHPWIEQVRMRKVFPNKILIHVEERKPIAIIQLDGLYYIDCQGEIFSSVGEGDEYNYPFFTGLSRQILEKNPVEGKRLIMKALELLRITSQEKVSPLEEISEIYMEKTFGIHCFTKTEGVEVRMGWEQFEEKLKRLSLIWADLQKKGTSTTSIDCSDLKRMIVKRIPREGRVRKEVMTKWERKMH